MGAAEVALLSPMSADVGGIAHPSPFGHAVVAGYCPSAPVAAVGDAALEVILILLRGGTALLGWEVETGKCNIFPLLPGGFLG
jgi:hypothetical protein